MIRLKHKRLTAVCLSICLTVSQSMISVPAYALSEEVQSEDGEGMKEKDSSLDEVRAELASPSSADHEKSGDSTVSDEAEKSGSQANTFGGSEENGGGSGGSVRNVSTDEKLVREAELVAPQTNRALLLDETTAEQITDWQWVDPVHALTDGVLSLSDVNPDHQVSFDAVVSKLPKKILATVTGTAAESDVDTATGSNGETGRQKEITLDGWSCDAFQKDGRGNWPTVGKYTFETRLIYGGGYIISDDADPLEVNVVLGGGNLLPSQSSVGDFTVKGGAKDADYSYAAHTLTILTGTALEISSTETSDKIEVAYGVQADITLAGVSITTSGDNSPLNMNEAGESKITLKEDTVNTLDGSATDNYGPGIYVPKEKLLTITGTGKLLSKGGRLWPGIGRDAGGNILIENGNIEAKGGNEAAGIGGSAWRSGGEITITGGAIKATGGSNGSDIGNGYNEGGSVITISGGTVTAAGPYGIGIGGPREGRTEWSSTFLTGSSGNAVIVTKKISDKSSRASWSGVIFEGARGQVYGNPTVKADFKIPKNTELIISGSSVLTVDGEVTNQGTLSVYGTLTGAGTLNNQGAATRSSDAKIDLESTGSAVEIKDTIEFTVKGGKNGKDYSYDGETLTILTNTPLEISSIATANTIAVAAGVQADITLAGVSITTSGQNSPLYMKEAGESKITLKEGTNNTLDGSATDDYGPGIYVPEENQLTITGTGELVSKGGRSWPGIGRDAGGNILIENGNIEAVGGDGAAGIGGSSGYNGGNIAITGGVVSARGGRGGSDIGNGYHGEGGVITISGGTVTATGDYGIGNGKFGGSSIFSTGSLGDAVIVTKKISDKSSQISWSGVIFEGARGQVYGNPTVKADLEIPENTELIISGSSVLTVNGEVTNHGTLSVYGTLTGAGELNNQGTAIRFSGAEIKLPCTGSAVGIKDAFTVKGGKNGEDYSYDGETLTILTNTPLEISSTETSDKIAVADGVQADITLAGVSITTSGQNSPLNMNAAGKSKITLKEGTDNTLDGSASYDYGPGIYVPMEKQLTITGTGSLVAKGGGAWPGIGRNGGGELLIESGNIEAVGGNNAAGIGGSSWCSGGKITITGGVVRATGGSNGSDIGNGYNAGGSIITISGGTVTAAGDYGIGDGGPRYGQTEWSSTFSTGSLGHAVIVTKKVSDKSSQTSWSGVIFEGVKGQVYGNPTVDADFEIPENKRLIIGSDDTLTVNGTMKNNGSLAVYGTLEGDGVLYNQGTAFRSLNANIRLSPSGNEVRISGTGDFTVTGGENDTDYSYADETLTIKTNRTLEISGTTIGDKIAVAEGVQADIRLAGVSITTSGQNSPLNMNEAGESKITLKEDTVNTLDGSASDNYGPGIYVPNGNQLTITGTGSLAAKGGASWPGIGRDGGGNILIGNGNIEAVGGNRAAGIGGSYWKNGGSITITGGAVRAAGNDSADIGSGHWGEGASITISGGTVTTAGDQGIGNKDAFSTGTVGNAVIVTKKISDRSSQFSWSGVIFEGAKGRIYGTPTVEADFEISENTELIISSSSVLTVNGKVTNHGTLAVYGTLAGVGTLYNQGTATRSSDAVIKLNCTGDPVEIRDTIEFTVKGGDNGKDYSYDGETLTILTSTPLEISGTAAANKIAVAANVQADIRLAGVSITTRDQNSPLNMNEAGESKITLKEDTVNTLDGSASDNYGPGIYVPNGNQLTITGTGSLVAKGSYYWPGIGRDGGGNILIENGNIEAVGGGWSSGIGGSAGREGGSITITGGHVSVTGDKVGIGGGGADKSSTFSTGESGSAFIMASSISDKGNQASWSGVIFDGRHGAVYGSQALTADAEIPAGKMLIIDEGKTLTLGSGICLTNKGIMFMSGNGSLDGQGNIVNDGSIYKSAQATLPSERLTGGGTIVNALDNISYDAGAGSQGKQNGVFPIHSDLTMWPSGWYIVDDSLSISDRSLVMGEVHLILADGKKLTAQRGINVAEGRSLTIYGQKDGTGELSAAGVGSASGIGAGSERNAGTITIKGGKVNARGAGGAGIGGAEKGMGGTIVISGGSVTAQGGYGAAGIGAGYGANNSDGSVTISGGRVTATGGYAADGHGGGAGIGGGGFGRGWIHPWNGNVTISGGIVTAYGASDRGNGQGAGIGGGFGGGDASFSTGDHGNALIFTSYISGNPQGNHPDWGGVIFQENSGVVYGISITPSEDIEISDGQTLTIDSGKTLIIDSERTLVNKGAINNNGTLIIKGTLLNYGSITGNVPESDGGTIKQSTKTAVSFAEADASITEAVYEKTITITAAVTPAAGTAEIGSVNFYLGDVSEGKKLGGDVAVKAGKAALEVKLTGEEWKPDLYTITAAYHAPSASGLMDSNGSGELRVKKISQAAPNIPEAAETTVTSITLKTVKGQRYSCSDYWRAPAIDGEEWETASGSTLVFSDLVQNKEYYFWTYIPGDEYTENSLFSGRAEMTTSKSEDQKAAEAAAGILNGTSYRLAQADTDRVAEILRDIEGQLTRQINVLPGMIELNIQITPDDIQFDEGDSATAGDADNPSGRDGYVIFDVTLYKGEGNTRGYVYIDGLNAVIRAKPYMDPQVQTVKSAIESGAYTMKQEEANTEEAVKTSLASQINALPPMAGSGIEVKVGDISVEHFNPAVPGDRKDRDGKNGSFAFSVALSRGKVHGSAAGMSGFITAARYKEPPMITTESLPEGKAGSPYTAVLEATGDMTIHWSIISGRLPEGLTLSGAVISGNPNHGGSFLFTVQAENGNAPSAVKEFTITVSDNSADGGSSHSSPDDGRSDDSGSRSSSAAAAPRQPQIPAVGESRVNGQTDQTGSGTADIPDGNIIAAIQEAKGKAGKGGISLRVNVVLDRMPQALTVTLSRTALDHMIAGNVRELKIENPLLDYSLNLEALKALQTSAADSLTITAKRLDKKSLSQTARGMIGNRPVFDLAVTSGGKAITSLGNGSACLWIPYTLGENETAAYVEAVYADDRGGAQWLTDSSYDRLAKTLKLVTRHLSVYGAGYRADAPRFADISGSWAKEDIEFAAARGLLTGTGETAFSPDSPITGEAFAAALGRLSGAASAQPTGAVSAQPTGAASSQPTGAVSSQPTGAVSSQPTGAASSQPTGAVSSRPTGAVSAQPIGATLEPLPGGVSGQPFDAGLAQYLGGTGSAISTNGTIKREQMAVIMMNFINSVGAPLPKSRESVTFVDSAHISFWAREAVTAMQMAGVMGAKDGNCFNPQAAVTRAEAAAILHRFVRLAMDPSGAQGWAQNDSGRWLYYEKGKPVTGWKRVDGQWYWLDASGFMQSGGWKSIEGRWYYFCPNGSMAVNTVIDGHEIGPEGARKYS